MTVFADYDFYINKYLSGRNAAVSAADFTMLARKATQKIKVFTGSNVDESNIPECVKMCCCEITELLYKRSNITKSGCGLRKRSGLEQNL